MSRDVTTGSRDPESCRKNVLEDGKGPEAGRSSEGMRMGGSGRANQEEGGCAQHTWGTLAHLSKPQPGQL